jgi:hypothetical protein
VGRAFVAPVHFLSFPAMLRVDLDTLLADGRFGSLAADATAKARTVCPS